MSVKFLYGESTNLETTAKVAGQILFTTDTGKIYYDKGTSEEDRIEINKQDFDKIPAEIQKAINELLSKNDTTSKTIEKAGETDQVLEVKVSKDESNILIVAEDGLQVKSDAGLDYTISVSSADSPEAGVAKRYTLTQKQTHDGEHTASSFTIDIPADKVIKTASLEDISNYSEEEYPAEQYPGVTENGTYLKITIDNDDASVLYVNLNKLIDVYSAGEAGEIQVTVAENKITASLVDGKVEEKKLTKELQDKLKGLEWQSFTPGE